jgi:hypothetical protein
MTDINKLAAFLDSFYAEIEEKQDMPNDLHRLIGRRITGIFCYVDTVEQWLDYCHTFLVIDENLSIDIPMSGTGFVNRKVHPRAITVPAEKEKLITGNTITNIHEQFDKPDPEDMLSVIFELSNGYFFRETAIAAHGTGQADLFIFNRKEFSAYKNANHFIFKPVIEEAHVQ